MFDVGGSVGGFAEAAVRAWPDAVVHSFEPLPDIARENSDQSRGRWWTHPWAISSDTGRTLINRNMQSPEASTLLGPGTIRRELFGLEEHYEQFEIGTRTLREFEGWLQEPALLKIDVEGAELRVLEGAGDMIRDFETVVIELNADSRCFKDGPQPQEILDWMIRAGFVYAFDVDKFVHDGHVVQYDALFKR